MPTYEQQTINTPNPIARFAHRGRYSLSLSLTDERLPPEGSLLDFGSGEGTFLDLMHARRPDTHHFGLEPYQKHEVTSYREVASMDEVEDASIDVLTCFEVLEHLEDDLLDQFARDVGRVLTPNGVLLVSVPIIGGPSLLLKELNRIFLYRRRPDYSAWELLMASMFFRPARRSDHIGLSDRGFDFRKLERFLSRDFIVQEMRYSPFKSGTKW